MKGRSLRMPALLLALVLALTACGGPVPASQDSGVQPQTQSSQPEAEKEIEKKYKEEIKGTNPEKLPQIAKDRKDTIVIGFAAPEGKFSPIYASTVDDSYVTDLIFEPLARNNKEGNSEPKVAERWEISPDGKTYTFYLRKGIRFTNGDELTAEDVAFTYTAICDPSYDGTRTDAVDMLVGFEEYKNGDAKSVEGIKIIDPYTISFTLKEVKAPQLVNGFEYGIMPKKYYDFPKGEFQKHKDMLLKPIGSGPYKFVNYKAGQEVQLTANEDYYRGAPKIKNVVFKVTNASTQIQELTSGGVDVDRISARPENISMLKAAGFIDLQIFPDNGYGYIGLSYKNEILKDKKVRQALAYGLNRQGFVDSYFKGYADVCRVPIAKASWAYSEEGVNLYEYNPEKANQLLDEAGWIRNDKDGYRYKDGKKLKIHWMTYTGSRYVESLIPIVKENWKDIGVEVIPELMEFATLVSKVYDKQEFEMYNMAWSLSTDPDPSGIFSIAQTAIGGSNSVNWKNEESERLLMEGLKTTDQQRRKEIYAEWSKIFAEDLPYILLDQNKKMWAVSSRIKGLDMDSLTGDIRYSLAEAEIVNE